MNSTTSFVKKEDFYLLVCIRSVTDGCIQEWQYRCLNNWVIVLHKYRKYYPNCNPSSYYIRRVAYKSKNTIQRNEVPEPDFIKGMLWEEIVNIIKYT